MKVLKINKLAVILGMNLLLYTCILQFIIGSQKQLQHTIYYEYGTGQ
jgi:hypothetical protein